MINMKKELQLNIDKPNFHKLKPQIYKMLREQQQKPLDAESPLVVL